MDFKPTITVTGRLAKNSEARYSPEGKPVTNFTIMLYTGGSKAKGYEPSLFVRIVAFGELAEQCQSLTKGTVVEVSGTPNPKKFYKNKDGVEVQADLEIKASKVITEQPVTNDEDF